MLNATFTAANQDGLNKEHLNNKDEVCEWADRALRKPDMYPSIIVTRDQDQKTIRYNRKASAKWGADWLKVDS